MSKRIVICADGTWNRPEKNLKEDVPTNVLRLARPTKLFDAKGMPQQVFYDWDWDPIMMNGPLALPAKAFTKTSWMATGISCRATHRVTNCFCSALVAEPIPYAACAALLTTAVSPIGGRIPVPQK